MKRILTIIFIFFLSFISANAAEDSIVLPSVTGIVKEVQYVDFSSNDEIQTKQTAEIKLSEGKEKGSLIVVDNMLTGNPYYDMNLKKGMKVILHAEQEEDGEIVYSVEDIKRSNVLVFLFFVFCGLLIYVGRQKGLYSLVSIVITCALIYWLLSPMILYGINPVLATMLLCIVSTTVTMHLVGGFNKKSTSAAIGCILSLVAAGILSYLAVRFAHISGVTNENSVFLYNVHPELNFVSITISMMILATLGAVMDVGMSISSTINEIFMVDNTKTVKELFKCGMNVGRDIIGTMANTLILVYIGGSLPLLLLSSNIDFQKFINLNQVFTEMASALIGSSAIVICVPITAIVASELVSKIPEDFNFSKLKN